MPIHEYWGKERNRIISHAYCRMQNVACIALFIYLFIFSLFLGTLILTFGVSKSMGMSTKFSVNITLVKLWSEEEEKR